MMRTACATAFVAVCFAVAAPTARAGRISEGLERMMVGKAGDEEIRVLVAMKDQAPIRTMDEDLRRVRASKSSRHRAIVDALRDAALRSQASLLQELDSTLRSGIVREYTPFWIINGVAVTATIDGIRGLASRSDVDVIEPDLEVELIQPLEADSPESGKIGTRGIGITPGLIAIEADRVWNELGIDGDGALVGNMDTGVDGTHPALAARWRGNFAPANECWRDGVGFGDLVPVDRHYHGTHVMGTICGVAPDDTIGVAPGARWIADNSINQLSGAAFDSDVVNGLQWFADPDGNSATTDDVPDVVEHSWGVNESYSGYIDCDSRWWGAIDNCEAAGVCLIWSAGNEGPGEGTIRSPADRTAGPFNTFCVGATQTASPFPIASLSSRGPSGCGGAFATKPEISAPGEGIYSAEPGGGYRVLSGTSMAGPHVAGVVALMRSANPDLDVQTIKQILMDTSTDLGDFGEDNIYGHGIVNAYEAVSAALVGYGRVEGTITDYETSAPIANALIQVVGDVRSVSTDTSGFFRLPLPAGTWTLEMGAFGYITDSQMIQVVSGETDDGSFRLVPAPTATLGGVVRDYENNPVQGATVTVLGTPIPPTTTQFNGTYSFSVPDEATYTLHARKNGLGSDQHAVLVSGPAQQDFILPKLTSEDFESGDFQVWPWTASGNQPWTIDTVKKHEGTYSARSGLITHGQTTTMELALSFVDPGTLSFWMDVSTQSVFDLVRFSIDGFQVGTWSGTIPWTQVSFPVSYGPHTFRWSYTKDASVNTGSDAVWIDLIEFPDVGTPLYPDIASNPGSLSATLDPDDATLQTLSVSNLGEGALIYSASVQGVGPAAHDPEHHDAGDGDESNRETARSTRELLTKGEPDDRTGDPVTRSSGGPDAFGYRWKDSDEPTGPVFQWVDIKPIGTLIPIADDTYTGPRSIGFPFPFYGASFSTVRISANGFLSFTSPPGQYWQNESIPTGIDPNNFIAAYWDDLNGVDGGAVYTCQDSTNSRFIVQWDGIPVFGTNGTQPQTFQVILHSNGTIVTQYKQVSLATSCTVGIENATGSTGLQVAFNASYLHNGLAIRYSPAAPISWLAVSPPTGQVAPSGAADLDVTYDATGLSAGVYEAVVRIVSNDPDESIFLVPVTLTVNDVTAAPWSELPARFELSFPEPSPFSRMASIRFAVPAPEQHVEISVFDVSGRRVRTLVNGAQTPGRHAAVWDGRDEGGRRVAAGIYFYRMTAPDFRDVKKISVRR